jgi:hypothetical protein
VLPLEGGADDDVGLLEEEGDEDEDDVGAADEGDAEEGALEGGEDGDVVEELDEGDEVEGAAAVVVVGALEDEEGAAALRPVVDINDKGPELNIIAERETIITRDKISVFLLIVTLELLLFLLSLLLSIPSTGPTKC